MPIRLNVLDIHHGFLPFIISLGREPESDSDWITWDNDLITLDVFFLSLQSGGGTSQDRRAAHAEIKPKHLAAVWKKKKKAPLCVRDIWVNT